MTTTQTRSALDRKLVRRPTVVATAALAALAVWAVAVPLLGADVTVPEAPGSPNRESLGALPVAVAALVASLLGWGLLEVLERVTARALTIWTVVAVLILVVTMPWDPAFSGTERIILGALHLTVAAVLIPGLAATSPRR